MLYNLSLPLLYRIILLHQLCYIIFSTLYYTPYSCCINYVILSFPPFTISHILVASIMLYNLSLPLYMTYFCCINYIIKSFPPFTISHILVASIMLYNLSLPLLYPIFLLHQLCYIIFPSLYYIPYPCCINYVI